MRNKDFDGFADAATEYEAMMMASSLDLRSRFHRSILARINSR